MPDRSAAQDYLMPSDKSILEMPWTLGYFYLLLLRSVHTFSFLLLSLHGRRLKAVLEEKGAMDFSV